ncbi:MAG: hypothetical protein QOD77_378 [Thermoplasmata archaeon]|nr:hypothetical protein [Thermoplasmata archaeon]
MAASQCIPSPDLPCRANLDLMPPGTAAWMYALSGLAVLVMLWGFWTMVRVWRAGKPWQPGDWRTGLSRLVRAMATHRKFQQDRKPGTMHAWIFFGFVMLFIGTTIVAIDADLFEAMGGKLLFGNQYLLFEVVLDVFGLLFVAGVGYAIHRRIVQRPPQLHRTRLAEAPRWFRGVDGDQAALWFLLLIGVSGFVLEGMRLRHQIVDEGINYAGWSFVGYGIANLMSSVSSAQVAAAYPFVWALHFMLWNAAMAVLPWTKLRHIFTSSLNLYFHDPKRQSLPKLPTPFNLQKVMESGSTDIPPVGYATIRDFTWKDRLSLDACTNCGRCEAQCPATAAGRPLSPRKLIQDLKVEMWDDWRAGKGNAGHKPRKLTESDGVGAAIQEATLWSCTTCRACVTACPVDIEHVDLIAEMRRALVMDSKLDEHQQKLLVNITNAGNPYGFPASDRPNWTAQLPPGVVVPLAADKKAKGEGFEYLWWIGCSGSFDPRNQMVTRAVATLLNAAKVDFAILGAEERCNGDPARRLGEEGRFQQSAMENLVTLQQYGATKVIAQCPHCLNALGNEYPEFGATFEVIHHTQLLEKLLGEGRIPLKQGKPLKVTYHDSCYLMRHNNIADAPRAVLQKANNGLPVLEMVQNRAQGLCCGAGGANMWYEVKDEKTRINVIRAKQAANTGADTVATACPFCLTMMTDGLSLTGQEGKMEARDLAEIVLDHLDWTPPAPPTPVVAAASDAGGGGGWSG